MRKFYIIYYWTDYEGYDLRHVYLGDNYNAVKARYKMLHDYLYQRFFIDEGDEPDLIEDNFHELPEVMNPSDGRCSYMNNGNDYYLTYGVKCITKHKFERDDMENWYKEHCPKAKQ